MSTVELEHLRQYSFNQFVAFIVLISQHLSATYSIHTPSVHPIQSLGRVFQHRYSVAPVASFAFGFLSGIVAGISLVLYFVFSAWWTAHHRPLPMWSFNNFETCRLWAYSKLWQNAFAFWLGIAKWKNWMLVHCLRGIRMTVSTGPIDLHVWCGLFQLLINLTRPSNSDFGSVNVPTEKKGEFAFPPLQISDVLFQFVTAFDWCHYFSG